MKLAAVICVRNSSQRLPDKPLVVYDTIAQRPNLQCIIDRVLTSRHKPHIIVATSTDKSDDSIIELVKHIPLPADYDHSISGISVYRGSLNNVVERFNEALTVHCPNADYVWRVMADNPLIDIGLVDWRLDVLMRNKADALRPILPEPTYAAQSNVWSRESWDYCAKHSSGSILEHPGEFIYQNWGQFRVIQDPGPESVYYQPIRTELDTAEDLEFFKRVWTEYPGARYPTNGYLDTNYVLQWLSKHPDIVSINAHIKEKTHTTYLHGHHRARRFKCANDECGYEIASKVNERLDVPCPRCGAVRSFYP